MPDNTDEELSDNQKNTQSKKTSEKIISAKDKEAISQNQENENMEIHHHPDLHHKPKKWKEYFLEFLMIFLAVTLGFFAEDLREHVNDNAKEKEFMTALIDDLKSDTSRYQQVINEIKVLIPALDSSYINIKEGSRFNYTLLGKWQFSINQMNVEYRPGLATIQQMKSSGNLRLIKNKEVEKQILDYEAFAKGKLERGNDYIHAAVVKVYAMEDALCDYTNFRKADLGQTVNSNDTTNYPEYNMPILDKDILKQNEFANSFISYKASITNYRATANEAKENASYLIKLINKEYHFE